MRDGRLEVRPPVRLSVVAVGTRVGEDIHAAVTDFHREGIGVGVRGDGQESVRAAVAAAPYLGRVDPRGYGFRSQDRYTSICKTERALVRAA